MKKLSEETKDKIKQLKSSGKTAYSIAKELGVSQGSVNHYAKKSTVKNTSSNDSVDYLKMKINVLSDILKELIEKTL